MIARRTLQKIIQESKGLPCCALWSGCSARRAKVTTSTVENSCLDSARPFEEMPSQPMLPLVGSLWLYLPIIGRYSTKKQHLANHHKHQVFGDVVRERFGKRNIVYSFRPEDLEAVYRNEGPYPNRGGFLSVFKEYREMRKDLYPTAGFLLLEGEEWRDLRSKTQKHLLKPKAILAYLEPMQEVTRDFTNLILELRNEDNEVPNLIGELNKWSLESVTFVGLDTRLGCLQRNLPTDSDAYSMLKSTRDQRECIRKLEGLLGNIQLWKIFPTPTWNRFVAAADVYTNIIFKYIKRAVKELKRSEEDRDLTLLQAMLSEKGLGQAAALATVADTISGGIETTTYTAAFLLYHLGRNQKAQEKLYEEIIRCLPNKEDKITPAIYNELRYLKSCMKESQRLTSITTGIGRLMMDEIVISGYKVPAETFVIVVLQEIGKMEKYFKNAETFLPERWMDRKNKPYPFAFLPFGFGVRSCIGRRLAELEIMCLVTDLIRNFRIEYHFEEIGMNSSLINEPDRPLRISFFQR